MKKLKFDKLSPGPLIIIMAIAVLFAVPVRMFQYTSCLEASTGFWLAKDFTVYILYILCAVVVAVSFIISLFSGVMHAPQFDDKKDIPLGIFSVIFAITLVADAILQISKFLALYDAYPIDGGMTLFRYILTSGTFAVGLQILFGILAAVYIAFVAYSYFLGNGAFKKRKLLAVCPAVYAMGRLAYHFIDPISYKNVSQLFLQIIMLIFMILFTFSFARLASGINAEKSMWLLWFSGISGSFMAYVVALAPIILTVSGKGYMLPTNYPVHYCDLAFALFTTAFLFTVMPRTVSRKADSGEKA